MGSDSLFEYSSRQPNSEDGLFLERLEIFMEKCLADIKAFSERESRPFEETRRSVAEWHARYLFQSSEPAALPDRRNHDIRSVLMNTSRALEDLAQTAGVQSFLLAIDTQDPNDEGFLGGSLTGREFWRDLRGGGSHGAKAFKAFSLKSNHTTHEQPGPPLVSSRSSSATPQQPPGKQGAKSIKTELYDTARKALRHVSGVRNAEMKWSNPERLDIYNVRLVGWPTEIPSQNPSTLKVNQNKLLLEAFKNGTIKFEKIAFGEIVEQSQPEQSHAEEDFSWAYDPDAVMTPDPDIPVKPSQPVASCSGVNIEREASNFSSPGPGWQIEPESREPTQSYGIDDLDDPWDNFGSATAHHGLESHAPDWYDDQLRYRKRRRDDVDDAK